MKAENRKEEGMNVKECCTLIRVWNETFVSEIVPTSEHSRAEKELNDVIEFIEAMSFVANKVREKMQAELDASKHFFDQTQEAAAEHNYIAAHQAEIRAELCKHRAREWEELLAPLKANAHALAEERSDDSVQAVLEIRMEVNNDDAGR